MTPSPVHVPPPAHVDDSEGDAEVPLLSTSASSERIPERLVTFLFGVLCLCALIASCGFSLAAPFFPQEAVSKQNCGALCSGIVFAVQPLAAFVGSLICAEVLRRKAVNRRTMLVASLVGAGAAFVVFGFVMDMPPPPPHARFPFLFVVVCCVLRALSGVCSGAIDTTVFAMVNSLSNNERMSGANGEESDAEPSKSSLGDRMGKLELAYGLGYALGPAFGSVLYSAGGFAVPFVVMGLGTVLVIVPAILIALHGGAFGAHDAKRARAVSIASLIELSAVAEDDGTPLEGSIGALLVQRPEALVTLMSAALSCASFGALDPTLETHLIGQEGRHSSSAASGVGLLFALVAITYCLGAIPTGRLADRNVPHLCITAGLIGIAIGFFLLGAPSFPIPSAGAAWKALLPNGFARSGVAMGFIGPCAALAFVPAMPALILDARMAAGVSRDARWEAEEGWHDSLSGALSASWSLGAFLGPLLGGAAVRVLGFDAATGVISVALLSMAVLQAFACGRVLAARP